MIKYINNGELGHLRTGFYVTLLLKLISNYSIEKFKKLEYDLPTALKLYMNLVCLNEPQKYRGYSGTILKYLLQNKVINQSWYDKITTNLQDDTDLTDELDEYEDSDDDCDDYYEQYEIRESLLIDILKAMGSRKKVNVEIECASSIYAGNDINESLFCEIQKDLRNDKEPEYFLNTDIDELIEEYVSYSEVDCTVVGIEGYEFDDHIVRLLQKLMNQIGCANWDSYMCEVFVKNGNTYMIVSYGFIESLNFTFLILIILAFMKN